MNNILHQFSARILYFLKRFHKSTSRHIHPKL
nr:MAG TPA_asm: hypothetical protein [Caudoviricetes sp.]DAV37216.1 MAG TPA: hypothetical protein [Caudoviricetes sp.]